METFSRSALGRFVIVTWQFVSQFTPLRDTVDHTSYLYLSSECNADTPLKKSAVEKVAAVMEHRCFLFVLRQTTCNWDIQELFNTLVLWLVPFRLMKLEDFINITRPKWHLQLYISDLWSHCSQICHNPLSECHSCHSGSKKSYMTNIECNLKETKICTTKLAVQFLLVLVFSTVKNVLSNL